MRRKIYSKSIIIIISAFALLLCKSRALVMASPATGRVITLEQPDGKAFQARLIGDEFMKIYVTVSGNVITSGEDGYYRYGIYSTDGTLASSEWKVGEDVPAYILSQSSAIPYEAIRARAKSRRMNREQEPPILKRMSEQMPQTKAGTPMQKHGIILLAEFQDVRFKYKKEDFVRMLTEPGYSYNGATGSARDYFNNQFKGSTEFTFDVSDIITLEKKCAHYGRNDGNNLDAGAIEMVIESCRKADVLTDFSKYDDDGDGTVDNVFIFFAGGDEAEGAGADKIWSHAWEISQTGENLHLDGKKIDGYACTAEISYFTGNKLAGIGTFCHEYSHTLGFEDYYDTDYEGSGGLSKALWMSTALMDGGNSNNNGHTPPNYNAIDRETCGLSQPEILKPGRYSLEPIDISGKYYRLDTDTVDEYFLFECRRQKGWDSHIGGSGLLIYHIDKSSRNSGFSELYNKDMKARERWLYNEVNCRPDHECCNLIEATVGARNVSQVFFPTRTVTEFTPDNVPRFTFWSDKASPLSLTGIHLDGENVCFTVSESGKKPGVIKVMKKEIYQDAVIICWDTPELFSTTYVELKEGDVTVGKKSVKAYSTGKFSVTFENLKPKTSYSLRLSVSEKPEKGYEITERFTTKSERINKIPFIYLNYVERNPDGSFPKGCTFALRLFNATDAEAITWYMDDKEIRPDESGFYTPERSGVMKAVINYHNGSRAMVRKDIVIR